MQNMMQVQHLLGHMLKDFLGAPLIGLGSPVDLGLSCVLDSLLDHQCDDNTAGHSPSHGHSSPSFQRTV